jgi:L,D-transpeptidase catalytic domain
MKRRGPIVELRQSSTRGEHDFPNFAESLAIEPWTIGTSVSSGCIRMINQDAIDLYQRVALGARVVVLPSRL